MWTRRLLGAAAVVACTAPALAAADAGPEVPPWESHGFSVVAAEAPRWGFAGQTIHRRVALRNDGSLTWTANGPFQVSYHWRDRQGVLTEFEGRRTKLLEAVSPGGSAEVLLRVLMPASPGVYRLEIDLLERGVRWFSSTDPTPAPSFRVFVLPDWAAAVGGAPPLLVALIGMAALGRREPSDGEARVALLAWLATGLLVKPTFLYAAMETSPQPPAGWLGALAVLIAASLLAPLPRRMLAALVWAVAAAASAFVWADLLYFRFFEDVLSVGALHAAGNLRDLEGAVGHLARPGDLFLFLDLPVGVVLAVRAARASASPSPRRLWALAAAALALAVAVSMRLRDPRPPPRNEVRSHLLQRLGFWPFYGEQALASAVEALRPARLAEADRAEVEAWFDETRVERAGREPWFGVARRSNLLLLQVESMQDFVVDLRVEGGEITPHLNRLARQALRFSNFYDQTGAGRSSAGDFIAQTSIVPVADSVAYAAPGKSFDTIASQLAGAGYATLSAVPYRASFWNRRLTHATYGYRTSLFVEDFTTGQRVGWGLSDRDFLRQMRSRLAGLSQPWCVWLTTLSLHFPYAQFPAELKALDLGQLEGSAMGNYLHGMSLFDRALGELLASLAADGLLDQTVVAVWGDHDATLVWPPGREAADPELARVRKRLGDRVPFVVRVPGEAAPTGSHDRPAGHLDIAPTLLALLGVDPGGLALQGRNLLGEPADRPIVHPGGSWVTQRHLQMEDGSCWELPGLGELPAAACAAERLDADRQLEVARLVLRHDLQTAATRWLAATVPLERPAPDPSRSDTRASAGSPRARR